MTSDECASKLKQTKHEIINGMIAVIQALDPYTRDHSRNVANYALSLAAELKLTQEQITQIYYGALFHDIGKIGISPDILKKQGPLTLQEYELIKDHPAKGAHIIAQFSQFHDLAPLILHHHENFDGSGYPQKLKGYDIPLGARIIAVVDAYDALTTNRPYRKAQTTVKALAEIIKNRSTQFDPEIVQAFEHVVKHF